MFRNFLKIAWRNFMREKIYSTINVLGLSLGICASVSIYIIVSYEFSFDRFHPDHQRIYRITGELTEGTGKKSHFARLPFPLLQSAKAQLTGADAMAGFIPYSVPVGIEGSGKKISHFESNRPGSHFTTTIITDASYFDIFSYEWLAGNRQAFSNNPDAVVLTEKRALQYFGKLPPEQYLGKQIVYNDSLHLLVTGIIRDWGQNSDFGFTDFISAAALQTSFLKSSIISDSWDVHEMNTWIFMKLKRNESRALVEQAINQQIKERAGSRMQLTTSLEPLANIHFNPDIIENPVRTADKTSLFSLIAIGTFILLLAIINFINLSTAQSMRRAKEVGVRKVLGSSRQQLIAQFLAENLLLVIFACCIGLLFIQPVLYGFRAFLPAELRDRAWNISLPAFLIILTVTVTLLSGYYPAKVLSSYRPVLTLRGANEQRGGTQWWLRKGLIIFQLTVSLVFMIGATIISKQLSFTKTKDPGFTTDGIISISSPRGDSLSKIKLFVQRLKQLPGIANVATEWVPPMTSSAAGRGRPIKLHADDVLETGVVQVAGNEELLPLYNIQLVAGRNFFPADSMKEIIINENLCAMMGYRLPADAIGKIIYWDNKPFPVVGVVKNFHTRSFHELIAPLCIVHRPDRETNLAVKLDVNATQAGSLQQTINRVTAVWKEIYPHADFNFSFLDEFLQTLYEKDRETATLVNAALAVSLFISCMGLLGLILFSTERKAKEISIRKVLGADVSRIIIMLCKDQVRLVIIALLLASPVAWYLMNHWLNDFAYRINISIGVFVKTGCAAIFIATITVSARAVKAALINPVKNLRKE